MLGRELGHFELLALIGQGGMGAVYKARDTHLDRTVALKVLPAEKMADPERKRRFAQEARAASALNHPNIITIYDIASDQGVDFIAMEYVEGQTLEALIASGPMRTSDVLKYARQMADALASAHAAGILHRDLKPANVMIRGNGLVKLLDFGLAKLTDAADVGEADATRTMAMTQAGAVMGTVAYMSPEQAEGKRVDFRSDIFSFGVVLYEMVSGQRAFPGESQASVLAALLRDEPRPILEVRADAPLELVRLIARCLRKEPVRRVQTMAEVKALLDEVPAISMTATSGLIPPAPPRPPGTSRSAEIPAGPPPPPPKRKGRKRYYVLATVAVLWLLSNVAHRIGSIFDAGDNDVSVVVNNKNDAVFKPVPLTGKPGIERQPSFSEEGTEVAYSWNGPAQDNFDIYVKAVGGAGEPRRLTANPREDFAPAWSRDGQTIAFLRRKDAVDEILLIPVAGGQERKVAEIVHREGNSVDWMRDGRRLVFPDSPVSGMPAALYELTPSTGAKRRLVLPGSDTDDLWPRVSRDGDDIAFVRRPGANQGDIFIAEVPDSDESDAKGQRITSVDIASGRPAWTADGQQIIFGGASMLWRVPLEGKKRARPLVGLDKGAEDPAVSSKSDRLVYGKQDGGLWLVEGFR